MDIQKATSSPADPNAPSFLSTLPPEIRNTVYEVLFKRDEPVLLHNAKTYRPVSLDYHPYYARGNMMGWYDDLSYFDKMVDIEIDLGQHFTHDFQLSTPFLLTCRQIYSEAVGIFYGHNTFIFSRPIHRHDCFEYTTLYRKPEWENDAAYFPTNYASQWLTSIGSQFKFLKKVEIDVGAICPHLCPQSNGSLPLWSLLKVLWKHAMYRTVAFAWREPSLSEKAKATHASTISHPFDETSAQRTQKLNAILRALGAEDVLQLKHFAFTDPLLSKIDLQEDFTRGYVHLPRLSDRYHFTGIVRGFHVSDQGVITWDPIKKVPILLHQLPFKILSSIIYWTSVFRQKDGLDSVDHLWPELCPLHGYQSENE